MLYIELRTTSKFGLSREKLRWITTSFNLLMHQNTRELYLKINPKGQAPRIIRDGAVITESIDVRFKARATERATL